MKTFVRVRKRLFLISRYLEYKVARSVAPKRVKELIRQARASLLNIRAQQRRIDGLAASVARIVYAAVSAEDSETQGINNYELKVQSQNGEDGILLFIFSRVGGTNCRFVEFGVGDGRECNTANLSLNFGWSGLLMDAEERNVAAATKYYESQLKVRANAVKVVKCLVTAENIDKILSVNGVHGEIDLLSIDIDGNDYWVWEAITVINPRVVVIEYNASFGKESVTVKYDPNFDRFKKHPTGFYHGASLSALTKLANSKGYILVGCESNGVNAFFVRQDVAHNRLFETSVDQAFFSATFRPEWLTVTELFEILSNLELVHVK